MNSSRFLFQMDMAGNAEAGLGRIEERLSRINAGTKAVSGGFMASVKSFQYADRESASMGMFTKANNYLENTKDKLMEFSQEIVKEAAAFQDIESSLKFSFGADKWGAVFEDVKKDAANLTFSLAEVSELAASLGRMKINPFGGDKAEDQQFMSRTGQKVRALEILQDTADAAGKKTEDLTIAIRNAMGGQWTSLATRFDIDKNVINKLKKETAGLAEPQEKYNALIKQLGVMFGGAGALKTENWTKIAAQVPDLVQQLKGAIGADGLKLMASALKEFVTALTGLVKNKDAVGGLADAFTLIARGFAAIIRFGAMAVETFGAFAGKAPWVWKIGMFFIAVKVAIAAAIVAATTFAGALAAVVAAMSFTTWPIMLAALAGFVAFLPGVLALGAAFVGVAAAAKFGAEILTSSWGAGNSTISGMEKIKLVLTAIGELMDSYDGRTAKMSAKTADALQKGGLMGAVKDIYKVFHRARRGIAIFQDALDGGAKALAPTFLPMLDEMKKLVIDLAMAFGLVPKDMDKGRTGMDSFKTAALASAKAIIDMAKATVFAIRVTVGIVRIISEWESLEGAILGAKIAMGLFGAVCLLLAVPLAIPVLGLVIMGLAIWAIVEALQAASDAWKEWKITTFGSDEEKAAWGKSQSDKAAKKAASDKATEGMSAFDKFKYKAGIGPDAKVDQTVDPFAKNRSMAGTKYRDKEGNFIEPELGAAGPMGQFKMTAPVSEEDRLKMAKEGASKPVEGAMPFDNFLMRNGPALPSPAQPGLYETVSGKPDQKAENSQAVIQALNEATVANRMEQAKASAAMQQLAAAVGGQPVEVIIDREVLARAIRSTTVGSGGVP